MTTYKNVKFYKKFLSLLSLFFLLHLKAMCQLPVTALPNTDPTTEAPTTGIPGLVPTKANVALSTTPNTQKQEQPTDVAQQAKPAIVGEVQQIKEIKTDKTAAEEENANIYLNFENVSLSSVVNYLTEQKNINLAPQKDVAASLESTKVSLSTRTPLTLDRAWNVLLTLLEMNSFSMINVNGIYRIVSSKDNGMEPMPIYSSETGTQPEDLPESDQVVRYLYFFKNIKTDMARNILGKMLDDKSIIELKDLQAILIKDLAMNIKAAMKIVKELDLGGLREAIRTIPLQNVNADNVQKLFEEILGAKDDKSMKFIGPTQTQESAYFSQSTRVIAEPVKNSLILLGPEKDLDKITSFILKYIDIPMEKAASLLHIKEIRFAKAEELKPILDAVVITPKGVGDKTMQLGGYKFFDFPVIAAEQALQGDDKSRGSGNRLIISCSKDDWKRLEKVIDKLDKPQPQVALEVMIINITSTQYKELGAQTYGIMGKQLKGTGNMFFNNLVSGEGDPSPDSNFLTIAEPGLAGKGSPTFATLGRPGSSTAPANNIWSLIRARFSTNNSQIIAQPFMVVNNRQPCKIDVSETRRVDGALVSTKGESKTVTKETLEAKNSITITPQINSNGTVDLTITLVAQEFASSGSQPDILNREVKTKASMGSGEVLVLGGLTGSTLKEKLWKTPILGDIPIVGNLFRSKTKEKVEDNLYVFIRPSIIKPHFEGSPDEYTQLKLDYAKYQILKNDTFVQDKHDPIQRWFFSPTHQTIKEKLNDAANGVIRPIDDFALGKTQPKCVSISEDKYYKVSESIEQIKQAKLSKQDKKRKNA